MSVDVELKTAQIALEDADRELRDAEKRRSQAEQQAQLIRGQLEQQRMEWQALTGTSCWKTATTCTACSPPW